VQGIGERLPLADASVDLVLSMQVLEHVQEPERVLREIDRVLRPGGVLYLSAPNYFSFSEDHYRVLWFPGLTHRTGSWYLRLRGRDPEFYRKHVNNLTYFQVQRTAKALGWTNLKWERRIEKARDRRSLGGRISKAWLDFAPGFSKLLYLASKSLKTDMNLHFRKPGTVDARRRSREARVRTPST
jgi:SAM-dependent methyltransferase